MKSCLYTSVFLLSAIFASCSSEKEDLGLRRTKIEITVETEGSSRTELGDDARTVTWSKDDEIYLFDSNGESDAALRLKSGAGETAATFSGTVNGKLAEMDKALYPVPALSNGVFSFDFPAVREYVKASNAPMIGDLDVESRKVQFSNLCALVRVGLADETVEDGAVLNLELQGQSIAGTAVVDVMNAKLSVKGENNSIKITGIPADAKYVDIPVPAGSYTGYKVMLGDRCIGESQTGGILDEDAVLIVGDYTGIEEYVIMNLNVDNPLITKVNDKEGNVFTTFGNKDANGYPISLESLMLEGADGSRYDFVFGENGMPELISSHSGVKIYLDWMTDTYAAMTAIEPTSGFQLNTYIDLENGNDQVESKSMVAKENERQGKLRLEVLPLKDYSAGEHGMIDSRGGSSNSSNSIPVTINLEHCGGLANAECYVDVFGSDDKFLTRCKGVKKSDGVYVAYIPKSFGNETLDKLDKAEACENIANFMGGVCYLNNGVDLMTKLMICQYISAGIVGINPAAAVVFDAFCSGSSLLLELYCKTLGYGPMDPSAPTIANGICEKMKVDAYKYGTNVKLLPYVYAIPNNIYGQSQKVDLSKVSSVSMNVSWGGESQITSFTLNPPAPAAGQYYVGLADLRCLPAGTYIEMDIVGTDGYKDKKSYIIETATNNYIARLTVPGAAAGVRNVCNVVVTLPDGKVLKRTAALVFQ